MTPARITALLAWLDSGAAFTNSQEDDRDGERDARASTGIVIKGYVVDPADLPAIECLLERWPAPAAAPG